MSNGNILSKDVIDLWPEVFGEVTLNVVPLIYVSSIEITFKNKKVWAINFQKNLKNKNWSEFENEIREMVSRYQHEIDNIDFKLDSDQIKKDVGRATKQFLKNTKLK